MIIGIPIYEKVDLRDVAAPYEMFNLMKQLDPTVQADVCVIAEKRGSLKTRDGLTIKPQKVFADVPVLDVLWVPGGDPSALTKLMNDRRRKYLDYLISSTKNARFVASVCEGAMAAGKSWPS